MKTQPNELMLWAQLISIAIVWATQRYAGKGKPLNGIELLVCIGFGMFAGAGLALLVRNPSLSAIVGFSLWSWILVAAFVAMIGLALFGAYYRITRGRPVDG